uniref:C2H2-type domain-containing protein n=1 Tax=Panagrolaimus sp. ES5 TaxID=591445 RepID=A0AC34GAT4_9BILA
MSQINGHLQGVPQMTISFANGGAPTMVSHIPTHIQVPLPPPSTSTVVVNNGAATTSTPNRQNSTGSNNAGSSSSSTSTSRSRTRNSTDGNMVKCNFCPRKISTNMVDAHRNECRMIRCHECPQCGKRFKARGGLQQHSRIHLQERAYGCKFCPKRFTQKSHLDQHERIHTGK